MFTLCLFSNDNNEVLLLDISGGLSIKNIKASERGDYPRKLAGKQQKQRKLAQNVQHFKQKERVGVPHKNEKRRVLAQRHNSKYLSEKLKVETGKRKTIFPDDAVKINLFNKVYPRYTQKDITKETPANLLASYKNRFPSEILSSQEIHRFSPFINFYRPVAQQPTFDLFDSRLDEDYITTKKHLT